MSLVVTPMLPNSPSNIRLGILPVLTWGVALASVLIWSDRAVSSCGDYVMVGNPRHVIGMVHGELTPFFLSKGSEGFQSELAVPLTPPRTPCQGPYCRQDRSEPSAPIPVQKLPERPDAFVEMVAKMQLMDSLLIEFVMVKSPVTLSRGGPLRPPRP